MSRRLVVEADGGSRSNPGPAAYGSLVRDADTGRLLATRAEYIGVASNNVAEYGGLVAGLHLAREIDAGARIEVRMDSKLVVEQMSGRWKIKHPDMQRLAAEARAVVPPQQVRYTWIPREQNKDADRLANEALDDAAKGRAWRGSSVEGAPAGGPALRALPATDPAESAVLAMDVEPDPPEPDPPAPGPPPDVGTATTVLLLRHGVTDDTLARRFSGRGGADLPLNAEGELQAAAAAVAVAQLGGVDVVVCSPLQRARQTAHAVVDQLAATGRPVDLRVDEGWVECAFGEWDGLTSHQVAEHFPGQLRAWYASTAVAPPGGESLDDVGLRVALARDKVLARHPRARVLVVTHATPIQQMVRASLGADAAALWRLESSPAGLTTTRWWADGGAALGSYNETAHLRGITRI